MSQSRQELLVQRATLIAGRIAARCEIQPSLENRPENLAFKGALYRATLLAEGDLLTLADVQELARLAKVVLDLPTDA